mmetsp:Transcript_39625/g.64254  ORF Transcript_39625/g.64254 Transcript_39625/m.64254 type:complete len:165 (-) Transcript_39625:56-550(-)
MDKGRMKRPRNEPSSSSKRVKATTEEGRRKRDSGTMRDVQSNDISQSEKLKIVASFDDMGLKDDLLRGIYAFGFEKPSAIQQRAILPIVKGRDLIAQSQSGTGKTAVFCIGVLQVVNNKERNTQALILSPTRELAEQTQKVLLALGDQTNIQCHSCIGGKKNGG